MYITSPRYESMDLQ